MKLLVLIILFILSAACTNEAQSPVSGEQTNLHAKTSSKSTKPLLSNETRRAETGRRGHFTSKELVGHRLTLVSKTAVGEFSFMDKGYVVANIGSVNGPIAGPLLEWKIDRQGRLVIDFYDFKEVWTKLSEQGDLIEIECTTGTSKPHRHDYIISRDISSPPSKDYPKTEFSTEELAGSILQHTNSPHPEYRFNVNGSGIFRADTKDSIKLGDGERSFRWAIDQKGKLQMVWASGRVMTWRKLSRANDVIVAEFTEPPSPPTRATYRRSKQ